MLFINTRPNVHYRFDDGLDGVQVIDLPLLELSAIPILSDTEHQWLMDFVQGEFKVVIVVSVMAVRCALAWLVAQGIYSACDLARVPSFVAVGHATKQALAEFGIHAVVPTVQSNEGMLQLPVLQNLNEKDRVLIWRGVGGRRLVDETLSAKGIDVQGIALYQRQPNPELLDLMLRYDSLFGRDELRVVLISSQLSLTTWQSLHKNTKDTIYLALGKRLYGLTVQTYPDNLVMKIASLDECELSLALKNVLQ